MKHTSSLPSRDLASLDERCWDAIVIGAGPAGAVAAHQLAQRGCSVLLVDKATFPRRKVCGCYLNGSAISTLRAIGLDSVLADLRAPAITRVTLGTKRKTVTLTLPTGATLSRESLDTELVRRACSHGAEFLSGTEARVAAVGRDDRTIDLVAGKHTASARCKVALVADGIGGHALRQNDEVEFKTSRASLVGASGITAERPHGFERGQIYMAIGTEGYVGALEIEDGRIDIAGAFDPRALKASGPANLAHAIVSRSGLPLYTADPAMRWLGTNPLTRTPTSQAGQRFFLIGDAAGYVEPFTGEGMSWAMTSACAVIPLALQAISAYSPELIEHWNQRHRSVLGTRKRVCRFVTQRLRSPFVPGLTIAALARFPALASPFVRWLNPGCDRGMPT